MRRFHVGVALAAGAVVLGGGPALATVHSASSPDGGTYVHSSSTGGTFYVADTKCDNDSVHGNYLLSGHGTNVYSLNNSSGCGSEVHKDSGGTITSVQACTNYFIVPDNCSSWH